MNLLPVLRELLEHNHWARDRQLQVCAKLTPEEFLAPLGASFSSIRGTLAHLVGVEWIWLERWKGRSPQALPAAAEFPTLAAITERWSAVERDLREYVAGLTEDALALPLTITNTRGQEWTYPLWQMFLHLMNHQSYHRGQVTLLLRRLGAHPPAVDFLVGRDMGFRL
ncbi:MAG: DinB family protein [Bryobacteraceae bacterium]|jgi:uncharacterized damage-inducible protein DinB